MDGKRRFPWHTPVNRRWRWTSGKGVRTFEGPSPYDAITTRFMGLLFGGLWFLIGFFLIFREFLLGLIFLLIGAGLLLIGLYAHLSVREDERIEAEIQAKRDEKQRLWREMRRLERKAAKKRK